MRRSSQYDAIMLASENIMRRETRRCLVFVTALNVLFVLVLSVVTR